MDVLIERCAGMDVHRDTVVATVRRPGPGGTRRSETRTFTTMTGQLEMLADWLAEQKVTLVGMESTGIYWKPVVRHEALLNRVEMKGLRRWSVAAG
jgi:transposase